LNGEKFSIGVINFCFGDTKNDILDHDHHINVKTGRDEFLASLFIERESEMGCSTEVLDLLG